jgi:RNA polymerase sigma factor (sigma-70 family)
MALSVPRRTLDGMAAEQQTPTELAAVFGGLERAEYEQLTRELTGYCYRMLGSPFDAEDAVQDTMMRAWRELERFEGRSSLRTWLHRIATNVCIDMLRNRGRRSVPMDLQPRAPSCSAPPSLRRTVPCNELASRCPLLTRQSALRAPKSRRRLARQQEPPAPITRCSRSTSPPSSATTYPASPPCCAATR